MKIKLKEFLRSFKKEAVSACQISDGSFLSVKFSAAAKKIVEADSGKLPVPQDKKNKGRVIISLPRNKFTLRYLKNVPSQAPRELENIVNLQAPQFLPFPAQELITGYQIISTDRHGFTDVIMAIAHKEAVENCLESAGMADRSRLSVFPSSWGLLNLYNHLRPKDGSITMIVDIDRNQAEVVVVRDDKVLFSRSFRCDRKRPGWQDDFCSEIESSQTAYLKETGLPSPVQIVAAGPGCLAEGLGSALEKKTGLSVSALSSEPVSSGPAVSQRLDSAGRSFACLIGLALKPAPSTLDLLPAALKAKKNKAAVKKELLSLSLSFCGILVIIGLAAACSFDNKTRYLALLKIRLDALAEEARPLEEMDRRLKAIESRANSGGGLDALHELYRVVPGQLTLNMFRYDDSGSVVIRGTSPELNAVFGLVSGLERSKIYEGYSVKVNYATKRAAAGVEVVDFEIICRREKL